MTHAYPVLAQTRSTYLSLSKRAILFFMILTYRYRLKDRSAKKTLAAYAYGVNQVWNYCNAFQKDIEARYKAGAAKRKWPSHFDLCKATAGTSKDFCLNAKTINAVCHQFAASRDKAHHSLRFRSSGGSRRALGWVPFTARNRRLDDNSVTYMGKTFRWFGNKRRPLPDNAKGGAFVEDAAGKWYVCFHVEVETKPTGTGEIGIDLGLKTLATCSDGDTIPALQHYRKHEVKLATAQRARNKKRTRAIHAKIKNCRRDQIHKATSRLAKDNRLIAVGNVSSSRLVKTRMAKSVNDASWAMFKSQLRYKASRHGATFMDVDERFTTQVCSCCLTITSGSPKGMGDLEIREWVCTACGACHDRDVNAAQNILALALSAQRPVGESRLSR